MSPPSEMKTSEARASAAEQYLAEHWRLRAVAHVLSDSACAWKRLERRAASTSIRVLLAPWYRPDEAPRRRAVRAWRFEDSSFVVRVAGPHYPTSLETLPISGVSALMMLDSEVAARHALLGVGSPMMESLLLLYVNAHGALPTLHPDTLLIALNANSRAIRLAAIGALQLVNPALNDFARPVVARQGTEPSIDAP